MLTINGINYGDNTRAIWGVYWQGDYIYVGGTNTGLHIVDASNPAQLRVVRRVPTAEFGGISAGPLYAIGNLLVITTPKGSAGIATLDISDPLEPVLLDVVTSGVQSYIGGFYGANAYLLTPLRTYDVTSDPTNIRLLGQAGIPNSEYMSFGDGYLFLGGVRQSIGGKNGIYKIDISNPSQAPVIGHIPGRNNRLIDDQFSVPIGNLVVVGDDEVKAGSFLAVHAAQPDTKAPKVLYVNPRNGAVAQPVTSRIGLSFSDQIELTSVNASTLIVRSLNGDAISGTWSISHTVLNFWPDQPLQEGTTYEIVVPAGGISDVVGNGMASTFCSQFTTFGTQTAPQPLPQPDPQPLVCAMTPLQPSEVGSGVQFHADFLSFPGAQYFWDFGDGEQGQGRSATHAYRLPGRYSVQLTVTEPVVATGQYEAEVATLSGRISIENEHPGYTGSGFIDYPFAFGSNVKATWQINVAQPGRHDLIFRYANGGSSGRPLTLIVNGEVIEQVPFPRTFSWRTWRNATVLDIDLAAGNNTIVLVAERNYGPNIDHLKIDGIVRGEAVSCSSTQVVHHALLSASRPTRSRRVLVDESRHMVWTVNPDANTVTAVDAETLSKRLETATGQHPRTLAQAPDGTIWVVNQDSFDIAILHPDHGHLLNRIPLPYASQPYGIAFTPDGTAAFVTLQALGHVVKLDPLARKVLDTLALSPDANGLPPRVRGVAVSEDSDRVFVTRFISPSTHAEVFEIAASNMVQVDTITLANDPGPDAEDGSRGIPNYLSSIAISPDGGMAWIPSKKDNTNRGLTRDGLPLSHDTSVRTIVSQIDLDLNREALDARIDLNNQDMAFAAEFSRLGDLVFIAVQGGNIINVIDAYSGQQIAGLKTGMAPQGLALSADGWLFVQNFTSRTLSVFDVNPLLDATDNAAPQLGEIKLVDAELLTSAILRGKQIFYNASATQMSKDGYISCASCHLDGEEDGRVWDFSDRGEGLRNTITLQGRSGLGHGPLHWSGNFDEVQDFENDMRNHFGGDGFLTDADFNTGTRRDTLGDPKAGLNGDLDALAAYVASLTRVPASPYRNADGSLSVRGEQGKQIFETLDCVRCHSGAAYTDSSLSVLHDVGTLRTTSGSRLGEPLSGLDTPTLKGLWSTAPYLHDGSAPTLYDVIANPSHGNASGLSQQDQEALVAYLLQLDEASAAPQVPQPATNTTPQVNAGLDQTLTLPEAASLQGQVSDDGLPTQPGALSVHWRQIQGPATVAFDDPNAIVTTANLVSAGTYVLRLTADDGELITSDELTVTVSAPPVVSTPDPPHRESLVLEAEAAALFSRVLIKRNHPGYTGTGFADYPWHFGRNVRIHWDVELSTGGQYELKVRYANGKSPNRPLSITVNGESAGTLTFPTTRHWEAWETVTLTGLELKSGQNRIEMIALENLGPNVDHAILEPVD